MELRRVCLMYFLLKFSPLFTETDNLQRLRQRYLHLRNLRKYLLITQHMADTGLLSHCTEFFRTQHRHRRNRNSARAYNSQQTSRKPRVIGSADQYTLTGFQTIITLQCQRNLTGNSVQLSVSPADATARQCPTARKMRIKRFFKQNFRAIQAVRIL